MPPVPPAVPLRRARRRRWGTLAETSLAARALPSVDYFDVFSTPVGPDVALEEVARRVFAARPLRLMRLRDALVRPFGLKTSPRGRRPLPHFVPGERVGLFTLFQRSEQELLLGEDDRHLDFRLCLRVADGEASLATAVRFRNNFGRAYFFLVRPFHAFVVQGMLRRATRPA
jgi:Protein of unknown function (DUF2867)